MPSFSWPGAVRNAGQQWLKVGSKAGWQVDAALEQNEKETFPGKPFPPLHLLQRDVSSRKSPPTQHFSPSELHPAALADPLSPLSTGLPQFCILLCLSAGYFSAMDGWAKLVLW